MPCAECEEDNLSAEDSGTNMGFGVQLEALHGRQLLEKVAALGLSA
jgi:hypothetical protein